jgi:hypothetical protein
MPTEVQTMLRLVLSLCVFSIGYLASEVACAQVQISDVPNGFFGAQRGRVVAHPHGGFRIHYGRGLTPQGAQVLTTAITTAPQIIGMFGVQGNMPGANAPASAPAADAPAMNTGAADPCMSDEVLDALSDDTRHTEHLNTLDSIDKELVVLLDKYKLPHAVKKETAGGGVSGSDNSVIDVLSGGGKIFKGGPAPGSQTSSARKPAAQSASAARDRDQQHVNVHIYLHTVPEEPNRPMGDSTIAPVPSTNNSDASDANAAANTAGALNVPSRSPSSTTRGAPPAPAPPAANLPPAAPAAAAPAPTAPSTPAAESTPAPTPATEPATSSDLPTPSAPAAPGK